MGYQCDLTTISLEKLKNNLLAQMLLPSQAILLEDIDEKFKVLKQHGISNMMELHNSIKNKDKIKEFSKTTGLDEKYLTVLRRELSSYRPKPCKIADFTLISDATKHKMLDMGIKTTAHLFDYLATKEARKKFAVKIDITEDEALRIAKLCDVSRLRYVNHAFSQLLIKSSYDTVKKIKSADHMKLYEELKALNEGNKYYTGHIGPKDMDFLVRDKPNADIVMEF